MEPGFVPPLIDLLMPVPDAASVAGARAVRAWTGLPVGGSTGTNLWGALDLIARMRAHGTRGLVVSLICDAADRHLRTYHDDTWTAGKGLSPTPFSAAIEQFLTHSRWQPPQPPPG